MKQIWDLKQSATDPDSLEMYIYGVIKSDSYDYWTDEKIVSETSANHFREELTKYPNAKNINLYVNSNGGLVLEAMGIRSQLKRHSATVTGYVDGFAASAASFILTACDTVKMYSNTMQFLHNALDVCMGNAKEMRKAADNLDAIMVGNRQAYLEKSGGKITEEKLIEILDNETWLTAQECLDYGLCDEIVAKEADMTEAKQMLQQMSKTLEQHISHNNNLAAQLREMATPKQAEPAPIPAPAAPVIVSQTNADKFKAAFSKKG